MNIFSHLAALAAFGIYYIIFFLLNKYKNPLKPLNYLYKGVIEERKMERVKKLYCVIPERLFQEIDHRGYLRDIDNIVTELLYNKLKDDHNDQIK